MTHKISFVAKAIVKHVTSYMTSRVYSGFFINTASTEYTKNYLNKIIHAFLIYVKYSDELFAV